MNGTDSGACQHGDRQFHDHGQINAHPVTLLNSVFLQYIGKTADLPVKLLVCKDFVLARVVTLPDKSSFVLSPG